MTQNKKIFIRNFLNKSKEAIIDAKINIKNNRFSNAQNRIYYAIFYSVMALGYLEDFISSKHQQLMGWFNKKFIYDEKIFNEEMYKIYKDAYENRQEADYSVFSDVSKDEVLKSFENLKFFIKNIEKYILKKIKFINT